MTEEKESLHKEDLFLLLESYKNSVEMNTLISQQLSGILDILRQCKDDSVLMEVNIKDKIIVVEVIIEKIRDKLEGHEKENIKSSGKIINRVNLLYVAIGSMVISLFWVIYQLIDKYSLLEAIALKLGV